MPLTLQVEAIVTASRSDVGRRRAENQDSCGDFLHLAGARLLILADGMGGHKGGRIASRACVDAFARVFQEQRGTPEEQLRGAFSLATREIFDAAHESEELDGMGTTGVALLISSDGSALLGWVGDSRAYRWRDGALEQVTEDHSLVAQWVREGIINATDAQTHPRRSVLTKAIGIHEEIVPDLRELDVAAGDRFLLCSDGLSGLVPERDVCEVLGHEQPERAVDELVGRANELGGTDNISVQIAWVPDEAVCQAALAAEPPAEEAEPGPKPAATEPLPTRPVATPASKPAPQRRRARSAPAAVHVRSALTGAALTVLTLMVGYVGYLRLDGVPISPAAEPARSKPASAAAEPSRPPARSTPRPQAPLPESAWDFDFFAGTAPSLAPVTPPPSEGFLVEELIPEAYGLGPLIADAAPAPQAGEPAGAASWIGTLPNALIPADQGIPDEIPTAAGFDVDPELRRFLDAWLHAAVTRDYAAYRELGFPDSAQFFDRTYVRWRDFRFKRLRLEQGRGEPNQRYIRAVISYAFENPDGRWRTEDEHRLVLGETSEGLRYQARWK